MAYCQQAENISKSPDEQSWKKLQLDAHHSRCKLCQIISAVNKNGGSLTIAAAQDLGLTPYLTEGNAWVGADPQLVAEYQGQQILVQK